MSVTITTSAGLMEREATPALFDQAFMLLFQPDPLLGVSLEYVSLFDDAGNELTLTARGTLRLYFGDAPDTEYTLRLAQASEGLRIGRRFITGDLSWVRELPWERNSGAEPADAPALAPPGGPPEAEAPVFCPRCNVAMEKGSLFGQGRDRWGERAMGILWTAGDLPGAGSASLADANASALALRAMRCHKCGHVEFFAGNPGAQ